MVNLWKAILPAWEGWPSFLLRLQLIGRRRELLPAFSKSVVRIGHHHERTRIGLFNLQLHACHFFIAHHQKEHFLIRTRIKSAALDAGGRTVEIP